MNFSIFWEYIFYVLPQTSFMKTLLVYLWGLRNQSAGSTILWVVTDLMPLRQTCTLMVIHKQLKAIQISCIKVQPLVSVLSKHFPRLYNGTRGPSIESVILFQGCNRIKQYNLLKHIKQGCKLWCIANQMGYILNFDVRQRKNEALEKESENCG
jgi:hypothetical protein